ncbi:hypothetical protein PHYPSEUDO_005375 [Phytophthora pseudosyringae]|uniref:Selenoprotein F/M domain-containing protein n=1 Tax=Phytophthora pseudosyringae TaxID=221518 RepID=A0A8T1VRG7_9STRA|nr:hypothetical protein PHYPSEUDO_005375 [Phytophthora pseudosyringae]
MSCKFDDEDLLPALGAVVVEAPSEAWFPTEKASLSSSSDDEDPSVTLESEGTNNLMGQLCSQDSEKRSHALELLGNLVGNSSSRSSASSASSSSETVNFSNRKANKKTRKRTQVQHMLSNIESHLNENSRKLGTTLASKRVASVIARETTITTYQATMRLPTSLLLAMACLGGVLVVTEAQEVPETPPDPSAAPAFPTKRLDRCATLGFDADALDCRLCDELSTFLTPTASKTTSKKKAAKKVAKECQECCSDFSKVLEAEGRRYPKVALAVNPHRLKRYPKVANFVERQAEQIKRLEVQESNPRLPMLQFFDEDGEKVEEISVAHWDEDSIAEFIENKLLPEEEGDVVETTVKEEIVEMEVEADKP